MTKNWKSYTEQYKTCNIFTQYINIKIDYISWYILKRGTTL